jgi:hypothetical protein
MAPRETFFVRTQACQYAITYLGYGAAEIAEIPQSPSGNRLVNILGSSSEDHGLLAGFLGLGMRLEVQAGDGRVTRTAPIEAIVRRPVVAAAAAQGSKPAYH